MNLKITICLLFYLFVFRFAVVGQNINIANVSKVKLSTESTNGHYYEVVNEHGDWKCYQVRYRNMWSVDSNRILVRKVDKNVIEDLINSINKPDVTPVVPHYQLDEASLLKCADSVFSTLKPYQKNELIKALKLESVLGSALLEVNTPEFMGHSTNCAITVLTTDNKSYELTTMAFDYLDYAAWTMDKTKYFNPDIFRIFNYLRLKDKETAGAKSRMYVNVVKMVYSQNFETKFNWADFKETAPASFKLMSKMFNPLKLYRNKNWLSGEYSFSRLPDFVSFRVRFNIDDLAQINLIKRREDSIVNIYKRAHFLVKHFKSQPGATVVVNDENDGKHQYFRFAMKADNDNHSDWLVVDGKSIVLVNYSGELKDPFSDKFEGITPNSRRVGIPKQCYLIYDMDGRLIGGNKPVGHSDLIFKK